MDITTIITTAITTTGSIIVALIANKKEKAEVNPIDKGKKSYLRLFLLLILGVFSGIVISHFITQNYAPIVITGRILIDNDPGIGLGDFDEITIRECATCDAVKPEGNSFTLRMPTSSLPEDRQITLQLKTKTPSLLSSNPRTLPVQQDSNYDLGNVTFHH